MDTLQQINYYKSITISRTSQADSVYECLNKHFNFNTIECIETGCSQDLNDGCFGLYLAKIAKDNGGIFHSVDINKESVEKSKKLYEKYIPDFTINHHISDSVKFLTEYSGSPNLVHLDSYDLNLKNPIPSMLHCWLEFQSIKDKMISDSMIIIDDNYLRGTWVSWNEIINGQYTGMSEKIDITYDIIGKGSLIYHWAQKNETDWDLVGNHYTIGNNVKVIIKKR